MGKHADDLCFKLREHLRAAGLRVGDQLPGERELASALGVGRTALRPCLDALEAEGVIERRPQSGTYLLGLPAPHARGAAIALIAPFHGTSEPGRESDPAWLYRVVSAFERAATPAGARLQLLDQTPRADDPCSVKDLAKEAIAGGARAAVLLHPVGPREKVSYALALLHDAGVHPVIVSSLGYPGLASRVYFDSAWGGYLAARHLLQKGHRRVGFAGVPGEHEWKRERLEGYRAALEVAEIEPDARWTFLPAGVSTSERLPLPADGAAALDYLLSLSATVRPTAVVAANDTVALGLLDAARARGVAVPGALSVVGFDNDPGALLAGLTTVERPTEALGEAAARVTLERIAAGPAAAAVTERLRPVLIARATVGPPAPAFGSEGTKEQPL